MIANVRCGSTGDVRKIYKTLGGLLAVALLANACGGAAGGAPGDEGGAPGETGGTLLIDSTLSLRSLHLNTDVSWGSELATPGGDTLAVLNPPDGDLYLARFTASDSFTIQDYDPVTLEAVGDPMEWPGTSLSTRINGLAFPPDGSLAAATIRHVGSDFLHVIDLSSGEPQELVPRGFQDVIGDSVVWLDNERLAFSMDLRGVSEVDYDGAIVAVDVHEAAGNTSPDLTLVVGFGADTWVNRNSVTGLTLNADGDELLYSLEGEIYVKDAPFRIDGSEPHQLTTGAMPHFGAVFSPNASEIAFVEYHEDYQSGIFMIPNHRGAAIEPDDSQLITRTNVRRLVGWLP